jgi:hypothetical protein
MKRQHDKGPVVMPHKNEKGNMNRMPLLSLLDWDNMPRIEQLQAECFSKHESGMSYEDISRTMGGEIPPSAVKELSEFFFESRRKKYGLSLVNAKKNREAVRIALWKMKQDLQMEALHLSRGQFAKKA